MRKGCCTTFHPTCPKSLASHSERSEDYETIISNVAQAHFPCGSPVITSDRSNFHTGIFRSKTTPMWAMKNIRPYFPLKSWFFNRDPGSFWKFISIPIQLDSKILYITNPTEIFFIAHVKTNREIRRATGFWEVPPLSSLVKLHPTSELEIVIF